MDEILIKLSVDGTTGNVNIQATDSNLQKLIKTVKDADQATKNMSDSFVSSFQNMRNLGQGFEQAYGMLESVFGTGIKKAMEYELSLAKLSGVIRSGGKDNEVSAAGMAKSADQLSKSSMFFKTDILDVERYFLSFKNIGAGSIDEATQAAMGLTQVLGLDLRGATIALGKALDQGSEGMKSLNRMGLKLSADELDHVKNLEDEGKTYEMQSYILTLLASKYKDVAEEIQKTDAFKLNQAQKALEDIQKQAGTLQLLTVGPLLTGLSKMINAFDTLNPSVKGFTATTLELTIAFGILNSTGIGKSIMGILQYGVSINSMRANTAIATMQLGVLTEAQYAQASAAISAAAANKGFFASLGPIGWSILAVTAFATVWGMVSSKVDKTKQAMSDEEGELRKQQQEYKTLSEIIKDSTKSSQDRSDAIGKITSQFPEYIGQNKLDNLTESEKNKILEHGNELFEERIKLQGKKDLLTDISKKLAEAGFDRDKKKETLDQKNLKDDTEGGYQNKEVNKAWFGANSGEEVDYNNADEKYNDVKKDYDKLWSEINQPEKGDKTEDSAVKLLEETKTVNGKTNKAIDNYVKELTEIDKNLIRGSAIEKQVKARIKELGNSGGNGISGSNNYKMETKTELESLTQISDMYSAINKKWDEIDKVNVKKHGSVDNKKSLDQQQREKFSTAGELGKNIDSLMKDKVKNAEVNGESLGEDKIQVTKDKLQAMLSVMNEVDKQSEIWKQKGRGDFPVISKQKLQEWASEVKKTQNEIDKSEYDEGVKKLSNDEESISKRMEIENVGEVEKLLLKESYLKKELDLAKQYHQADKVAELNHKLEMLQLEKDAEAKKMLQKDRDVQYDLQISKAGRTKLAPGVTDDYSVEKLNEEKKYQDDLDALKENASLTDTQKKLLAEELEKTHQMKINDIKKKYYDDWLGELTGLSQLEIQGIQQTFEQIGAMANSIMSLQQKQGQEDANNYRTTENAKLAIQKTAALAAARTDQQKQKVEADYVVKQQKIDDDANAKGQDKIRTMFEIQKAVSIANAIISTYEGADKTLGAYPAPIGAILMAATIAAGLANVAVISSQQMPKFAIGGLPGAVLGFMARPQGFIQGPGSGTSDSILARISNKEFIVNATATERNRMLLEQINKGSFSSGGYAGNGSYLSSLTNISNVDTGTVNEIKALSDRVDKLSNNLIDMIGRISSQPVIIGDRECMKITQNGIGKMKRSKV